MSLIKKGFTVRVKVFRAGRHFSFPGQYDYGPMGCDLVDNMLSEWQKHFVIQERMLKVNCSILTPEPVLKASGHVDKFADYMVKVGHS